MLRDCSVREQAKHLIRQACGLLHGHWVTMYRICSNKRPFDYKPGGGGGCDQVKRSLGRTIF